MTPLYRCLSIIFLIGFISNVFGGGIRGTIYADDGTPLGYATIFVKQLGTGTTTNVNGTYEISLAPGSYDVVFQYLGYETQVRSVTIDQTFQQLDITLKTQIVMLQNVEVHAGKEDPAYTIMRKAIAKAKYHTQQIDHYTAQVYIKGSGQLKDYPWIAKKQLEKEGIKKDRVFITESVSEIRYKRPNHFEEKVISIHSDGKDNNTSPNVFIYGNFYNPEIADVITPFSPRAFSYYKFEYLGTFKDRDYEVSRIKVTPRSKGDNVVEGMLYLIEDWWSIHSYDMRTTKLGVKIDMKAVYAPIEDKAWLPVSYQFKVHGKIFGFDFEYNYLSTLRDYKIEMNPDLFVEKMEVIDEKLEKEKAKQVENSLAKETQNLQKRLEEGKEITRKELRTIVKEYEKQELKKQDQPDVVSNYSFKIDSGAYKKDSTYWNAIRSIPLTRDEIRGYQITDSLAVIEKKREEGDTLKPSKHKGFQVTDLVFGDSYKTGKRSSFRIDPIMPNFNTVDGLNLTYRLSFGILLQDTNRTRLTISPVFRYGFAREAANGMMSFRVRNPKHRLDVDGGRYIRQYNAEQPILPIVNTFTTLLLERNLMKLYERDFVSTAYRYTVNPKVSVSTNWSWNRRRELFNNSTFTLIDRSNIEYTPNRPFNAELPDTSFPEHEAFIGSISLTAKPWLKHRIRNGRKYEIAGSSPIFNLDYRKGFSSLFGSDVDFDHIEAGVRHGFDIGVRGKLDYNIRAGFFPNASNLYFMDYKHFLGNRTPFTTTDPVGSFRLLDYYIHSTADRYLATNVHYHFRKFLVTRIPLVRMTGIRENVFVNYLNTPSSQHYTELGYSIDGILRVFRLEAAAAFRDGKYVDFGVRLGIATSLTVNFSDN